MWRTGGLWKEYRYFMPRREAPVVRQTCPQDRACSRRSTGRKYSSGVDTKSTDTLDGKGKNEQKKGARQAPQSFFVPPFLWKSGGRYKDRTCDPYHVKVVLYR